jgi:hypothetical protein
MKQQTPVAADGGLVFEPGAGYGTRKRLIPVLGRRRRAAMSVRFTFDMAEG